MNRAWGFGLTYIKSFKFSSKMAAKLSFQSLLQFIDFSIMYGNVVMMPLFLTELKYHKNIIGAQNMLVVYFRLH